MKVGDLVRLSDLSWQRVGLVVGYTNNNMVLVFWGEDFPHEEEYREQLVVMT